MDTLGVTLVVMCVTDLGGRKKRFVCVCASFRFSCRGRVCVCVSMRVCVCVCMCSHHRHCMEAAHMGVSPEEAVSRLFTLLLSKDM